MQSSKISVPSLSEMDDGNMLSVDPVCRFQSAREQLAQTSSATEKSMSENLDSGSASIGPQPASISEESNKDTKPTSKDNSAHLESSTVSKPAYTKTRNAVIISNRQRGNPVVKFIRNVIWEYGDCVPDYQIGPTCAAIFLSLKFHRLKPDYIHERLKTMGHKFALQVLLIQIDVDEPKQLLRDLNKVCILAGVTLILGWSPEEIARYIEVYKAYEHKSADLIMGNLDKMDNRELLIEILTSIRIINKTDAETLLATFGTLRKITEAKQEELRLLPGFGALKAKKLYNFFRQSWNVC